MKNDNPWLRYAKDDIDTLNILIGTELYRVICFHAQQLAEKSLKAYLFAQGIEIPKTHDVAYLFAKSQLNIKINRHELDLLSSVYIDTRYPPDFGLLPAGEPREKEAELAVKAAQYLHNQIIKILK